MRKCRDAPSASPCKASRCAARTPAGIRMPGRKVRPQRDRGAPAEKRQRTPRPRCPRCGCRIVAGNAPTSACRSRRTQLGTHRAAAREDLPRPPPRRYRGRSGWRYQLGGRWRHEHRGPRRHGSSSSLSETSAPTRRRTVMRSALLLPGGPAFSAQTKTFAKTFARLI